ncbi:hypothetical protein LC048_02775 [Mesobacillus subterraneus]|uniref:hypothetical protein n=1 Tax=Mesobacillus subterraneus TaxID=285983 RepID=UPI001CFD1EB6|nr:hypothetical protein [Mesobacillus subterraneus]WLR55941.1 hypothetical protein LC048_02775 [Mesobacillus subterraneus]
MHFVNEMHKGNYDYLMGKYHLAPGEDAQYESTIYVAAYPDIYKAINLTKLSTMLHMSPLYTLTEWNDYEEKHVFIAPELTGATRRMCQLALSLYNGFPVSLDDVFGSVSSPEIIRVLFQAMKIRLKICGNIEC